MQGPIIYQHQQLCLSPPHSPQRLKSKLSAGFTGHLWSVVANFNFIFDVFLVICQYLKLRGCSYKVMALLVGKMITWLYTHIPFVANSDKTFWFHNQWSTFLFLSMLLRYLWSWGKEMNFNITAEEEIALSLLDAKTLHGLCLCLCLLKAIV